MFPLRRYLSKVFSLSYHFDALLKNVSVRGRNTLTNKGIRLIIVAYSFRMGPVLKQLTVKTINSISKSFTITVSESILCNCLADSVIDNTSTSEDVTAVSKNLV